MQKSFVSYCEQRTVRTTQSESERKEVGDEKRATASVDTFAGFFHKTNSNVLYLSLMVKRLFSAVALEIVTFWYLRDLVKCSHKSLGTPAYLLSRRVQVHHLNSLRYNDVVQLSLHQIHAIIGFVRSFHL